MTCPSLNNIAVHTVKDRGFDSKACITCYSPDAHATLQLHGHSNELLSCATASLAQAVQPWLAYTGNPRGPPPGLQPFAR
jgi:hypothetical protein